MCFTAIQIRPRGAGDARNGANESLAFDAGHAVLDLKFAARPRVGACAQAFLAVVQPLLVAFRHVGLQNPNPSLERVRRTPSMHTTGENVLMMDSRRENVLMMD